MDIVVGKVLNTNKRIISNLKIIFYSSSIKFSKPSETVKSLEIRRISEHEPKVSKLRFDACKKFSIFYGCGTEFRKHRKSMIFECYISGVSKSKRF